MNPLAQTKEITLRACSGPAAHRYIDALAALRIEVFRDFPYLYDGAMDYEQAYLQKFLDAPDSLIVIAFDGDRVVGASTGMPLENETDNIKQPWADRGYDLSKIFYFGESVLLKAYRGQGIGVRFFEEREKWAKSLGRFEMTAFCGVVRPDNHPLRPADYVPLDAFWKKRGYTKTDDIICYIDWQDLDETAESSKPLHFWVKRL